MYLSTFNLPRSSRRWTSTLIEKIFEVAWDQWEHRNGVLHDPDNKFDEEENLKVNHAIRHEFTMGAGQLQQADKGLF